MKILVTHGSKRGGTAGIAVARSATCCARPGTPSTSSPRGEVRDVRPYDAVVVGGALYAMRWHRDARRLVIRHAAALRERPVWFFSSGPLDDSAAARRIPPDPARSRQLMDHVGARGHATFGGRLAPDARGFIASRMAKKHAGDFRDAAAASRPGRATSPARSRPMPRARAPPPARARSPCRPAPWRSSSASWPASRPLFGGAAPQLRPDGSGSACRSRCSSTRPSTTSWCPGSCSSSSIGLGNPGPPYLHARAERPRRLGSFIGGERALVWIVVEMILLAVGARAAGRRTCCSASRSWPSRSARRDGSCLPPRGRGRRIRTADGGYPRTRSENQKRWPSGSSAS